MLTRRSWLGISAATLARGQESKGAWKIAHVEAGFTVTDFSAAHDGTLVGCGTADGKPVLVLRRVDEFVRSALPETAESAFALDSATLWIAARSGIWRSTDSARSWKQTKTGEPMHRVLFVSPARGFAAGENKTALETSDGGATWTPIAAATAPSTNTAFTIYHWIDFVGNRVGIIEGTSRPPRAG